MEAPRRRRNQNRRPKKPYLKIQCYISSAERILEEWIPKAASEAKLTFDEASVQRALESYHDAKKAREERDKKNDENGENEVTEEPAEALEEDDDKAAKEDTEKVAAVTTEQAVDTSKDTSTANDSISIRVLYVVPPKTTKRRGDMTGRAYFVLDPPSSTEDEEAVIRSSLQRAFQTLQQTKSSSHYGVVLEESPSPKIFSPVTAPSKEAWNETQEYKDFLEGKHLPQKTKTTTSTTKEEENLPAIVLHLRKKKAQAEAKKKRKKKKEKPPRAASSDASKKPKGQGGRGDGMRRRRRARGGRGEGGRGEAGPPKPKATG